MPFRYIRLDQPAAYVVKVQGRLDRDFRDWFQGEVLCTVEFAEDGTAISVLHGVILDQAALHGLLREIRDLGLALLLVECFL